MRENIWMRTSLVKLCFSVSTWYLTAYGVTSADWTALNSSINGRLLQATPWARPCFSVANVDGGQFDQQACSQVQDAYTDRELRPANFAAYMNTQWETCQATAEQCLLDASQPNNSAAFTPPSTCDQGSISGFYIDVQNPSDVVAAYNFSRTTKVPLVVKNTGHDYIGRSSGPGTLALWTRNLQSLQLEPEFVPAGCPSSAKTSAATIGAGVVIETLYAFADAHNVTIPAGNDPTVGAAGGYFHGGGHSAVANAFGLGADRVLQVEIVVPTGEVLIANECQNSDLFFAVRGGGGSTFGVVLNVTVLALPQLTLPTITGNFNGSAEQQSEFLTFMVNNSIEFAQQGWGGFIVPSGALMFTNPLLNASAANASIQGLRALFDKLEGDLNFTVQPSWLSLYNSVIRPLDIAGVPVGMPFAVSSRLIPKDNFATPENQTQLIDTLTTTAANAPLTIIFAVGPLVYGNRGATSVNPVWYNSIWHVTTSAFWNFNTTSAQRQEIYKSLSTGMDPLRNITPGSGAYQNEADVYEPNHTESYWGSNYAQLLETKQKYDPDHLLDCWHCVGSNGSSDSRFRCYLPESAIRG